ncbi:ATP-binding cassette domain-containing protein [Streptomyces sp. ISL-36]|uniref:ATP-binding cassette domain-containing protein n=1 Tax=Streptomyces sp. ISL-36 TaxID=2819182 RepID=UPI001BEB46F3|nr:ATP-binding cassette domain-containing protein [Streptomyces sp. ISL-36]MBT2444653.1 ATP-binding cassette domain-containing protein [Streptomyces sp. ISL-36]
MPPAVETTALRKSYGDVLVLDSLDLRVEEGTVFALLGPNGAGKTTTVRILTTLTRPDAGHARVAGYDVVGERSRVRRAISLTGQFAAVDEMQTGAENLRMTARLSGLDRAAAHRRATELLERFGLADAGGRLVKTYSGGMRRRLDLAAGLVRDPGRTAVVFLDEPTTGLDPRSRQELWQIVRALSDAGTTVFLTTQYLEEADRLADRIAVMDTGRIVAEGTAEELKTRVAGHRLDLVLRDRESYLRLAGQAVHRSPETLTLGIPTDGSATRVRAQLDALDPDRTDVVRFSLHTATLDDVFLTLTAKQPDTAAEERNTAAEQRGSAAQERDAAAQEPDTKEPTHV